MSRIWIVWRPVATVLRILVYKIAEAPNASECRDHNPLCAPTFFSSGAPS